MRKGMIVTLIMSALISAGGISVGAVYFER